VVEVRIVLCSTLTVLKRCLRQTVSREGTIFGKWELEPAGLVQTDVNTC